MRNLKSLTLAVICCFCTTYASAQLWFDLGVKGAYGLTMMLNKNVFDDREVDHNVNMGYGFGGNLGIHFNDHQGIQLEYMRSTGKQIFDIESSGLEKLRYDWTTNDVMLLYRYTGYGAFFEIGPKVSFLSSIDLEAATQENVDMYFEDKWYSGVLGFGSYIAGSDLFSIQIGLRLHYQFSDMVNDMGQDMDFPVGEMYEEYKKTNLVMAQLHLEVNYAFGRFAKESCRDRWKLILFQ